MSKDVVIHMWKDWGASWQQQLQVIDSKNILDLTGNCRTAISECAQSRL